MDREFNITLLVGYAVLALLLLIAALMTDGKGNRRRWVLGAAVLSAGCCMAGVNLTVNSEALLLFTALCPLGSLFLLLGLGQMRDYRRCTLPVEAVCIGSLTRRHRRITTLHPRFRYTVNGRKTEAVAINTYSKAEFDAFFSHRNTSATIHIHPKDPTLCVHKPGYSRGRAVFLCVSGGLMLLLTAVVSAVTLIL